MTALANGSRIMHMVSPVKVEGLCQTVVNRFERRGPGNRPSIIAVEPEFATCLKTSLKSDQMTTVEA